MPATPKKGRRFGGSASHQKAMMGNLVASLIAAEGIVTTEAKAKALRPVAEKMITKAVKGGVHNQRQVVAFITTRRWPQAVRGDRSPLRRTAGRLPAHPQAGPRQGDNAPMKHRGSSDTGPRPESNRSRTSVGKCRTGPAQSTTLVPLRAGVAAVPLARGPS
jgi:large subunit ribosomal protein L17